MKILLVVYSCAPNSGSEDGVGWNMLHTLSLHHEVVVVTRGEFREQLESENLQEQGHDLRFVYVNNPVSRDSFINKKLLFQPLYYLWQLRAARKVRKITSEEPFDIVQHVNWIRCWTPSAIMGAASGKLVWGPVGGVESLPREFLKGWQFGRAGETMKKLVVQSSRFDPFVRSLARKATVGLATTRESQQYMEGLGCPTELLSEIGLTPEDVEYLSQLDGPTDANSIRFISMGRVLGWKGFHYGIEAFARANIPNSEYWIIGDGPARSKLEKLVAELGVQDRVKFPGKLKRRECLEQLARCHVLVHPSLRDSGAWVCVEAMAASKPVICLQAGGPGVNVTPDTGTIVPADSPEQVIEDIAAAMTLYASDPELLKSQGEAGLARVKDCFTWEKKHQALLQIYNRILGTADAETESGTGELVQTS